MCFIISIKSLNSKHRKQNMPIQARICYKTDTLWRTPNTSKRSKVKMLTLPQDALETVRSLSLSYWKNFNSFYFQGWNSNVKRKRKGSSSFLDGHCEFSYQELLASSQLPRQANLCWKCSQSLIFSNIRNILMLLLETISNTWNQSLWPLMATGMKFIIIWNYIIIGSLLRLKKMKLIKVYSSPPPSLSNTLAMRNCPPAFSQLWSKPSIFLAKHFRNF